MKNLEKAKELVSCDLCKNYKDKRPDTVRRHKKKVHGALYVPKPRGRPIDYAKRAENRNRKKENDQERYYERKWN